MGGLLEKRASCADASTNLGLAVQTMVFRVPTFLLGRPLIAMCVIQQLSVWVAQGRIAAPDWRGRAMKAYADYLNDLTPKEPAGAK